MSEMTDKRRKVIDDWIEYTGLMYSNNQMIIDCREEIDRLNEENNALVRELLERVLVILNRPANPITSEIRAFLDGDKS